MRSSRRLVVAATATLAVVGLAGCVNLPASGRVSDIQQPDPNGPGQVILLPVPPAPNWKPRVIVEGFLAASGSSLAVARDYLAPGYRQKWNPNPSSPTVIESIPNLGITEHPVRPPPKLPPPKPNPDAYDVSVTSKHVETPQSAGNIYAGNIVASATKGTFEFDVIKTSSGWRINSIFNDDNHQLLLLTQPDFLRDYQSRDLYFLSDAAPYVLVPYPVFIPALAQTQAGARELANDLLPSAANGANGANDPGPPDWLSQATTTAFPPGARISSVVVSGVKATVHLDLPAPASLVDGEMGYMEAQLFRTLTSSPYGGNSGISSVQLVVSYGRSALLLPGQYFASKVPPVGGGRLYFQALNAGHPVIETAGPFGSPASVPTPTGLGTGLFTDIAVLQGRSAGPVMLGACRGNVVYLAQLLRHAPVSEQTLPADCTALSWDYSGNLWVTSGTSIYRYRLGFGGEGKNTEVKSTREAVSSAGLDLPDSAKVTSFQVAPDDVRAAMIVRSPAGSNVFVTAISTNAGYHYQGLQVGPATVPVGTDIVDPTAVAWQSPDDLLVLGSLAVGGPQFVFQVPLTGTPSVQSSVPLARGMQWLTTDGVGVAVGTQRSSGKTLMLPTWDGYWQSLPVTGSTPVYSTPNNPAG